jgi:hypothetical protein
MDFKNMSERTLKIVSCIVLFLVGLLLTMLGVIMCQFTMAGIVPTILGIIAIIFGIIPMIAFWIHWQDLSGE